HLSRKSLSRRGMPIGNPDGYLGREKVYARWAARPPSASRKFLARNELRHGCNFLVSPRLKSRCIFIVSFLGAGRPKPRHRRGLGRRAADKGRSCGADRFLGLTPQATAMAPPSGLRTASRSASQCPVSSPRTWSVGDCG